jgi:hypothetical protein
MAAEVSQSCLGAADHFGTPRVGGSDAEKCGRSVGNRWEIRMEPWEIGGKMEWTTGNLWKIVGKWTIDGTSVVAQGTSWPMAVGLYLFKSYLKPCLIVDHISSNHRGGYIYNHIYNIQ